MQYWITTIGCKINQYESRGVARLLDLRGCAEAASPEDARLHVVNTCCVTSRSMQKCRKAIRRALHRSGGNRLLVLGCYSTYDARTVSEIIEESPGPPRNVLILGHHQNVSEQVADWLEDDNGRTDTAAIAEQNPSTIEQRRAEALRMGRAGTRNLPLIHRFSGRQRAFVKVQDGCDSFCSYCIVPYTRPVLWSKDMPEVIRECGRLVRSGHREIVLCGTRLGAYGRSSGTNRTVPNSDPLAELVKGVAAVDGVVRVRLSSLSPEDVSDRLLQAAAESTIIAPHFHIPLQSGSDRILKAMNRNYTAHEFLTTVSRIRKYLKNPAITTDIIVGHPGETASDFLMTEDVSRRAAFSRIHAFPFSPVRPTASWRQYAKEGIDPETARKRMASVRSLAETLAKQYRKAFAGAVVEGIAESPGRNHTAMRAVTERYLTVRFLPGNRRPAELAGTVVPLRITDVSGTILEGEIV